MRVVFMGTPEFALPALRALLAGAHDFEVIGCYTQPDRPVGRGLSLKASPVKRLALESQIPVFQPEKLSAAGEFEKLKELRPDVIVVVAYGQILKQNVLDLPRLGCVNIHSSLLPRWRGAAPIQRALLAGDRETGVTTMKLVQKLDAGALLLQEKTAITDDDSAGMLHDRLAEMGGRLILPTLKGLEDGSVAPRAQDESLVTYADKLSKEMEVLDPKLTCAELDRRVRALNPWPGTSVYVPERLKIRIVRPHPRSELNGHPGELFERNGMVLLGCADGALELRSLQWEGKKEVDAAGFLNGLRGRGQTLPLRVSAGPMVNQGNA